MSLPHSHDGEQESEMILDLEEGKLFQADEIVEFHYHPRLHLLRLMIAAGSERSDAGSMIVPIKTYEHVTSDVATVFIDEIAGLTEKSFWQDPEPTEDHWCRFVREEHTTLDSVFMDHPTLAVTRRMA